jgi:hypothetical protein
MNLFSVGFFLNIKYLRQEFFSRLHLHDGFLLKAIVFTVCEHEYMNIPPGWPIIASIATALRRANLYFSLLRISLICAFRIFSRFRTAFDGRRSTQAWLQNLAPFQVFINTSVIQDKTNEFSCGSSVIIRMQISIRICIAL